MDRKIHIQACLHDTDTNRNFRDGYSQLIIMDDDIVQDDISTCDYHYQDGRDKYTREHRIFKIYKISDLKGLMLIDHYYSLIDSWVYGVMITFTNACFINVWFKDREDALDKLSKLHKYLNVQIA